MVRPKIKKYSQKDGEEDGEGKESAGLRNHRGGQWESSSGRRQWEPQLGTALPGWTVVASPRRRQRSGRLVWERCYLIR